MTFKKKNKKQTKTKKLYLSRNKKKILSKTKKKLNGGSNAVKESMVINYPDIVIDNVSNGIDITGKNYNDAPNVIINNSDPNKIYMITMIDIDVPNGNEEEYKNSNKVFIHWVYIQTLDNKQFLIPYYPPSPPHGTHRYQFHLYDITNKKDENSSSSDLSILKVTNEELNKPGFRTEYYQKLNSFLIQYTKILKLEFTVTSNN